MAAEVAPRVIAVQAGEREVRYDLLVTSDLRYFEGHFPGLPLLPGVVQTHWAESFARQHFPVPPHFAYLGDLKFMRIIGPDSRIRLHLRWDAERNEVEFEYFKEQDLCSRGTIGWKAA